MDELIELTDKNAPQRRFRVHIGVERFQKGLITLFLLLFIPVSYAQMSLIGTGTTTGGDQTSAQFYAGGTIDGGQHYSNRFSSNDHLTLLADIVPEPAQIGRAGSAYVVVDIGGQFLMQTQSGSFLPWDPASQDLIPAASFNFLSSRQQLTILDDLDLAPLDVSNVSVDVYLGYTLNSEPEQLYYTPTPFKLTIEGYNPQNAPGEAAPVEDLIIRDSARGRDLPTLIYFPESASPAPVILFSHGLGSSRHTASYLGEYWSAHGYIVVFMQHPGSDASIYEGVSSQYYGEVFQQAASNSNIDLRINDVSTVLNQLERWNDNLAHRFYRRMDMNAVGMAGHSFGARTTQAIGGEDVPFLSYNAYDSRIDAVIPISPRIENVSQSRAQLSTVPIPWLVITGSEDYSPISDTTPGDRRAVFAGLPSGGKYELVLEGANHNAYIDYPGADANPAHHPTIAEITTAFWDAHLRGNISAINWLRGDGVHNALSIGDIWRYK